jgi:hypothetical protein
MSKLFYGLKNDEDLVPILHKIVKCFGGGEVAFNLMIGTCASETHCGRLPDRHNETLGVGVAQCDAIALKDVKMHIRSHDVKSLVELGYDIVLVELADLAYDPLLACAIMRLVYKRKTEPFPAHDDLLGLAHYWKDHYNSHHPNASGTPEKFIKNWDAHVPNEIRFL